MQNPSIRARGGLTQNAEPELCCMGVRTQGLALAPALSTAFRGGPLSLSPQFLQQRQQLFLRHKPQVSLPPAQQSPSLASLEDSCLSSVRSEACSRAHRHVVPGSSAGMDVLLVASQVVALPEPATRWQWALREAGAQVSLFPPRCSGASAFRGPTAQRPWARWEGSPLAS